MGLQVKTFIFDFDVYSWKRVIKLYNIYYNNFLFEKNIYRIYKNNIRMIENIGKSIIEKIKNLQKWLFDNRLTSYNV